MAGSRDEIIDSRINDIGRESFPEEDVSWKVLKVVHVGVYSFVEAEADPPTVGYPKFVFVMTFETRDKPSLVACYEGDGNRWGLLFSTPDTPSDWQDLFPKSQLTEGTGKFWSRDRDQLIRERINDIGRESFPEDTGVSWDVLKIVHAGEYSFVEAEPDSPEVGYPKFIFVLKFAESGKPFEVACYCFDKKRWTLLSSSEGTSPDWQELFPEREFSDGTKGSGCAGVVLAVLLTVGMIVCIGR
jgi:hypothetical protein